MAVRFACRCGKKMKATDDKIGKKVLCPECGSPVTVPESSTAAVEQLDSGGTAATASSLLKTSAEESKRRADVAETATDVVGSEFFETVKFVAVAVLPGVMVVFALFGLVYWMANTVMVGGADLSELGEVWGTVTLDGEPLPGAVVTFQPIAESGEPLRNVASSVGRTNQNGEFELTYGKQADGAVVGEHRVEIRRADETGLEMLPPQYNDRSSLTRVVEAGGSEFHFELQSR